MAVKARDPERKAALGAARREWQRAYRASNREALAAARREWRQAKAASEKLS
jgi:hypothetical protein